MGGWMDGLSVLGLLRGFEIVSWIQESFRGY